MDTEIGCLANFLVIWRLLEQNSYSYRLEDIRDLSTNHQENHPLWPIKMDLKFKKIAILPKRGWKYRVAIFYEFVQQFEISCINWFTLCILIQRCRLKLWRFFRKSGCLAVSRVLFIFQHIFDFHLGWLASFLGTFSIEPRTWNLLYQKYNPQFTFNLNNYQPDKLELAFFFRKSISLVGRFHWAYWLV